MKPNFCSSCGAAIGSSAKFCTNCGSPLGEIADGPRREGAKVQLPSQIVAKEFGEANVRRIGDQIDVLFTILLEPTGREAEGWQTGVALDASASMQASFGRGIMDAGHGEVPSSVWERYHWAGWLTFVEHQGEQLPILNDEAKADLVRRGYFTWTPNDIEPLARKMTAYLGANLDSDGGTTVLYWACGDGTEVEVVGDLTAEECQEASFSGPRQVDFGSGTVLTPAVRHLAERFADAPRGMYIFITDGELHDLEEVNSVHDSALP